MNIEDLEQAVSELSDQDFAVTCAQLLTWKNDFTTIGESLQTLLQILPGNSQDMHIIDCVVVKEALTRSANISL